MGDLTVIMLSIGMVIICWIMIKINDKIDRHIKRFKKLEAALLKNSTNKVKTSSSSVKIETPVRTDIPTAATSRDIRTKGMNFIAKK